MIAFMELLGEIVGNMLGLALETTEELASRYLSLIKRAAILWGIALLVSCGLYGLGYYTERGLFFGLGTGLISVATLVWLIIITPIWITIQKAAEKSPTCAQVRNLIITLTLGFAFLTVYIPLSHAWKNSNLFPILLAMSAFLTLMAVLTGKSINPYTLVFRAKILLFVVSVLIVANAVLPEEVIAKFQPFLKHTVNLEPKLISCSDSDFFESASVNPQPKVWYYMTEKGEYECYNNPGSHPKTGQRLISIDPTIAKIILQKQEDRKSRDKQIEGEKTVFEKLKKEELKKSKTEMVPQMPISQEEPESQSKPDNSESSVETPQVIATQSVSIELATLEVATTVPLSTERSRTGDVIEGVLTEPVLVNFDNQTSLGLDKGTRVEMRVIELQSAKDSRRPVIVLAPVKIKLSDGKQLIVSGDPVAIRPNARKEFLKGLGKTLLGTGAGAGLGAISDERSGVAKGALAGTVVGVGLAVVTRGKHIEVPIDYHIKIERVKIISSQ